MNNEVVIIGGNHHNTLSVLRCFGKRKVNFKILIHEDNKSKDEMMVSHSKYSKELFCVKDNEDEILKWLLDNKDISKKQVIIPCSDLAEYTIDNNYLILEDYYFIPGFKNNSGRVCELMDKYNQKIFAKKNNILMAKSWKINDIENFVIPEDIIYPCIVKPNISAKGSKGDITICKYDNELIECINSKYKKYDDIIIQQYINKKYELLAMGYISDNGYEASGVERKLRETIPGGGGSTALGRFVTEKWILDEVNEVLKILFEQGYRGLFDIEFFECEDKIYLNEINFRHSGSGFALIKNGIEAPYLYYMDCIKEEYEKNYKLKYKNGYFFCDLGEIFLLTKYKTINVFQFICDFIKSYAHSVLDINDLGVILFYLRGAK